MENNILLHWNKEKLIQQKQELVDAVNALEDEKSNEITQRMKDAINELEDKILETDGERYFLVDKNDENNIIIDFWKEFDSEEVEVFSYENFHLIIVGIIDSEDNDCYKIIDFNGETIVEFCKEFSIIGNRLKVLQLGYMLDFHYDDRNNEYWSIVDSDEIFAVQSIEYLEEYNIYLVNDVICYDVELCKIGNKVEDKFLGDGYLKFSSQDNKIGIWYDGHVLLEPLYSSIKFDYYEDFIFFITKKGKNFGLIIYLDNKLKFNKEFEVDYIELFEATEDVFLIYTKKNDKIIIYLYSGNLNSQEESIFNFEYFFEIEAVYLSQPNVFCGINTELNSTTIILTRPRRLSDSDTFTYYHVTKGIDFKNNVLDFFNSNLTFISL